MKEPNEVTPEFSDEIWLHILSFLDLDSLIKSLRNLELVSSKFRDLINDSLFWKDLFVSFFPKEIPPSLVDDFNWKNAFIPLYIEQYGYLEPETQKLIFLIAKGNIAALRRLNIRIDDLKADGLVLIKTAIRLNRQVILEYFYSISQQELPAQTEQDSLAKPKTDSELDLLYWVLSPREQTDIFKTSLLAAEAGHLDLLLKLLDSPENPATQNITKFHQLYSRVICSGQMYMLTGIEDFIARHKRQASSNPHSAKIVKASALLPNSRIVAASFGITSIFIRLNNQLQQKLISASASSKEVKLFKRKIVKEKASFAQAMEKAMLLAAEKGHIPLIKYALKKQFICINQKLCGDSSLLTKAALAYRPKLVQFLLANQADPELVLHELLRLNARIEPEGEQKRQNEEMILVLLAAFERQEKRCGIELLMEVIVHDRLDILERLFEQDNLVTDTLIRTLLQLSFGNCAKFLEGKLEQAQSATQVSNNSDSGVEEQTEPNSIDADNRHRFFDSASDASQPNSVNQHLATTLHG